MKLNAFWHKIREYSDTILGVLLTGEVISASINIIHHFFPETFIEKFNEYQYYISYFTSFMLFILTIILVFISQRYKKLRRIYIMNIEELRRCRSPESIFRTLSETNALCDRDLFEVLFIKNIPKSFVPKGDLRLAMMSSIDKVNLNIVYCINSIKDIFESIAENDCAVCVKTFSGLQSSTLLTEFTLNTLARDDVSRGRGIRNQLSKVGDNTALVHVINLSSNYKFFLNNDLREAQRQRLYVNTSTDWQEHYNATIVIAIPDLDPSARLPMKGVLCVDSKRGQFDDDLSLHYLRELAWRIGVMLYRLERLGQFRL